MPVVAATPIVVATPRAAPLPLLRLAPEQAPASVLGLDSDDSKLGASLTTALRRAFANRGLSGGEEIPLDEMRLTMGCTNDAAGCLAEGGKMLGVRRLVFGYMRGTGKKQYQLDIQILDTELGTFEAQASIELTKDELSADNIDATAAAIVNELMPADLSDSDLPARPNALPDPEDEEIEEEPDDEPPRESAIYFGLQKPSTPKWKWTAFGTSLGLTVAAGAATIGMGVWLTSNGGFRKKLLDTAEASLTDESQTNDVDPNLPQGFNLCTFARSRPVDSNGVPLGEEDQVRNSSVVDVCNTGDEVKDAQKILGIGTAVFGVATLAFTAVLLIHKRKPAADAMLRHGVQLGVAPTQGGLSIAGGLRF